MKNKVIAIILVMMSVLSIGCSANTEEVYNLTLDNVIKTVNDKNEKTLKNSATYDEAEYMIDHKNANFTEEEIEKLFTSAYDSVTKEKAKEDVDMLFRVLKHLYAGYTYFGGDEAFNKAKEDIIANIDAYEKSKISQQAFSDLIIKPFTFVKDSHFAVLGKHPCEEAYTYYESSKMEFFKTDSGYFTVIDDERFYLPKEYEDYLKITIGKSGELVYGIFNVATEAEKEKLPVEITLSSGSNAKNIKLDWIISEVGGDQASQAKYSEINSVAISSLSDMTLTEYNFQEMNDFLNNSKKHAEYKNSILDLRENNGGDPAINLMWIYGYTGELSDINHKTITFKGDFYSDISEQINEIIDMNLYSKFDMMDSTISEISNKVLNNSGIVNSDGLFNIKPDSFISNPNNLFVLQGKNNSSAGEAFLMMLDGVENVLSVGTNTNGCIHTGNVIIVYLPNSGVPVMYSGSIVAGLDKEFDVYGLEPDIYIASEDAQEAVLRCIEFYSEK
ncbi:MAG: S41 family peptidase [Ruminococcus sp.]|nr:S41 family peptidase [Ruminococcus sp.]